MIWYPLKITTPLRQHVFGGHLIQEKVGKQNLPAQAVAETWEISDVDGDISVITNGEFAGKSLRDVVQQYPDEMVAAGWRGPRFPLLTKFIDGSGMLPVHVHADDATAKEKYGEPNGKTEAWHILWAAPDATFLGGIKPGVGKEELKKALLEQDYDRVLVRTAVRTGETVYVPAGTIHSFGPNALIYEVEQTSNIQQHAMPYRMENGEKLTRSEWEKNIDSLLAELHWDSRPQVLQGTLSEEGGALRCFCCAGSYFKLERVTTRCAGRMEFDGAIVLTNMGEVFQLETKGVTESIEHAETALLPAACMNVDVPPRQELLLTYLPQTTLNFTQ